MAWLWILLPLLLPSALALLPWNASDLTTDHPPNGSAQESVCNRTLTDLYPLWDDTLYSCRGRCGSDLDLPCSCHDLCRQYRDCCPDFDDQCTNYTRPASSDPHQAGESEEGRDDTHSNLPFAECTQFHSRLIASCPHTWPHAHPSAALLEAKCREKDISTITDAQSLFPVTDRVTGYSFKNTYCLLCNGGKAADGQTWYLKISPKFKRGIRLESFQDVLTVAKFNTTKLYAVPPPGIKRRFCIPDSTWDDISHPCGCPNLQSRCNREEGYITDDNNLFRNPHCLLCFRLSTDTLIVNPQPAKVSAIEKLRSPYNFNMLMSWTMAEKDSSPASNLEESDSDVGGTIVVQAKYYLKWQRMVCETKHVVGNTEREAINTTSDNDADTNTKTHEDHPDVDNSNISGSTPTPIEILSTTTESTAQIAHFNTSLNADSPDTQPRSETSFDESVCSKTICNRKTYLYQGRCLAEVMHVVVTMYRSNTKDTTSDCAHPPALIDTDLQLQLKSYLYEIFPEAHRDFKILQLTQNITNTSMQVVVSMWMLRHQESWIKVKSVVSSQVANMTFQGLVTSFTKEGLEERSLEICVGTSYRPFEATDSLPYCRYTTAEANSREDDTPHPTSGVPGSITPSLSLFFWLYCAVCGLHARFANKRLTVFD